MRSTGILTAALLMTGASAAAWAQSAAPRPAPTRTPAAVPAPKPPPGQRTLAQRLAEVKKQYSVALSAHDDTRIDLDLQDVSIAEALKVTLQRAGKELVLDPDFTADRRVTLKAKDVKLSTALDLITESAGAGWRVEVRDGKPVYRIGKSIRTSFAAFGLNFHDPRPEVLRDHFLNVPEFSQRFIPDLNHLYVLGVDEERSTFQCPHCKGQTTVVRRRQQPKCTKCSRVFQKDWQFCPADGAKRPAAPNQWKFCPHCGKEVKAEKGAGRGGPAPDPLVIDRK